MKIGGEEKQRAAPVCMLAAWLFIAASGELSVGCLSLQFSEMIQIDELRWQPLQIGELGWLSFQIEEIDCQSLQLG